MKAFLSHSSKDKPFVEDVAAQLGLALAELDSDTFDFGAVNTSAILAALQRSSLFVLFLSEESAASGYVKFETISAQELIAKGLIEKFLVICLDQKAFSAAPQEWKSYNFVREVSSPQSIARWIQSLLIQARTRDESRQQPFVGRRVQLETAKEAIIDPRNRELRSLFVSGNPGVGRRTFLRKLFADVYPSVNSIFPEIEVERLDGYEELHRKLLNVANPYTTRSALRVAYQSFPTSSEASKIDQIVRLLQKIVESRELLLVNDAGGVLEDSGKFQAIIEKVVEAAPFEQHPSIGIITRRMMPTRFRSAVSGVVFCPLPALANSDSRQLLGLLLKAHGVRYSEDELEKLASLSDNHPFNASFIVQYAKQYSIATLLSDADTLVQWKHSRTADFVQKLDVSDVERVILATLKDFKGLDFATLCRLVPGEPAEAASSIVRLIDYHLLETNDDTYFIAPPLRTAVERDARLKLKPEERAEVISVLSEVFSAPDEDDVRASMIESGILAKIQAGEAIPAAFEAFLLPSHEVWVAKRKYDEKDFPEAIRLTKSALLSQSRLSPDGIVEACRFLCLAAARLGEDADFESGINVLRARSNHAWAQSNFNFLMGFNSRFKGHLPAAEGYYREALRLSQGNFHAARELASVCKGLGDLGSAEQFARQAFEHASDNAYILDIILEVLINTSKFKSSAVQHEIEVLFERLQKVGELDGRSFYTTRRAEYEFRMGRLSEARTLIDTAARRSPNIFAVQSLRAQIYLEQGNKAVAWEALEAMKETVYRYSTNERFSNLRVYLEILSEYHASNRSWDQAKAAFDVAGVFTADEKDRALRNLDYERASQNRR